MQRDSVTNQISAYGKNSPADGEVLTTSNGCPIDTITASMTAGHNGPIVLQVFLYTI